MGKLLPTIVLSILTFHILFISTTSGNPRLKWKDLHNPSANITFDQMKQKAVLGYLKFGPTLYEIIASLLNMIAQPKGWKETICPGIKQSNPNVPFPIYVPINAGKNLADWVKILTYGIMYRGQWKAKFCAEETGSRQG